MEIGSFRHVGRFVDGGMCRMIRCFGHFLGFEK